MDVLRALFESLGLVNIETFIASGNVLFEMPPVADVREIETKIEACLYAGLGYEVVTFIRSAAELAEIANFVPFEYSLLDDASIYIAFLHSPLTEALAKKVMAFRTPIDEFRVNGREVYWLCRRISSESTFSGGVLERALGLPATLRNSTTIKKIAAKQSQL
jgi:uncharacterized protein (DUF1697 family)